MKINRWLNRILRPQIVNIKGIKVRIPDNASSIIRNALYDGWYEAGELDLLSNRLDQDDVVMEIGTGLGLLSIYCAQRIGDDKVSTFEANPALEQAIKFNYALNQVAPKLEMCLAGNHSGFGTFYVGENFWSGSTLNKAKGAKPITVPVIAFNEKVKEINPTFLLLDMEGGEYEFVKYADFHNIKKLMIEIHSWILTPEQIRFVQDKLAQEGFHVAEIHEEEFYFERQL